MEGGDAREGRERGEALSVGRAGGRSLMEHLREQGGSASPPPDPRHRGGLKCPG